MFCNETLIVGPNHGVRYAVITLEGIGKGKAVEKEIVYELDNVLIPLVTRHEFVQRGRRPDTIQFEMVPEGVHVACERGASLGEETHDCAMGLVIGLLSRLSIGTTLSIW